MKELTIEEKAHRYDEAIERAKSLLSDNQLGNAWIYKLLPELEESEGERIRKALLKTFRNFDPNGTFWTETLQIDKERVVAWLEKQGEQKPAWSEEDEKFVHGLIRGLSAKRDIHGHTTFSSDGIDITKTIDWLASLKERYTWKPSDEQIKVCKEVYADLLSAKGFDLGTVNSELNRLEEQLKKLK